MFSIIIMMGVVANAAAAAGGILFFCLYIVFSFLFNQYDKMSFAMKMVSCLDMNVAMAFGVTVIGKFEGAGSFVTLYTCIIIALTSRTLSRS